MTEGNGHATAEELKAKYTTKLPVEVHEVDSDAWGTVYLRAMTGLEQDQLEAWKTKNGVEGLRARMLSVQMCTPGGESIPFTAQDIVDIGEQSSSVTEPLIDACLALNAGTAKNPPSTSTADSG